MPFIVFILFLFLERIRRQAEGDDLLADTVCVSLAASLRTFADLATGPELSGLDQFFLASPINPVLAVLMTAFISPG